MKKNVLLGISILIFAILILLDGIEGLWTFSWFLVIYLFFVIIPVSKNLYFENGTSLQKLILSILFILLTMDIFLSSDMLSLNGAIISLFLIVFLKYSSTTLQISPKYHPIINTSTILNIIIIISLLVSLTTYIIWDLYIYYDVIVSYILFILLIILSFVHNQKYKKNFKESKLNKLLKKV